MRYKRSGKNILLLGTCMLLFLAEPVTASAAGDQLVAKDILQVAGAGELLNDTMTEEEYIAVAREAEGASWGYTNLGIANVSSGNLNIREIPSTEAKTVGKLPKDAACEIISTQDGWAYITSGEVTGYVSAEYLLTGADARMKAKELVKTVARVTRDGVNVRESASLEGTVMTAVPAGEELEYVALEGEWVQVAIDGEPAYIHAEYVEVEDKLATAVTMTELLYGMGVSDVRVDLVEYAKQFLGNPYVWGGTSLTKGADCSGFTLSIFKKYGITLSHSSQAQSGEGTAISQSELKPGDLIFYGSSARSINHVAIYIGGSQVIHASSPSTGIKISKYNYRTPVKYVRVIND